MSEVEKQSLYLDATELDRLIISRDYEKIKEHLVLMESRKYEDSKCRAESYYITGNGHAALASAFASSWSDAVGLQVKYYKKSQYEVGFSMMSDDMKSRVYANLGNALYGQGRYFEALQEYNKAIATFDNPLAYFFKGRALLEISQSLYDDGHAIYFQKEAYPVLKYVYEMKSELFDEDHQKSLQVETAYSEFVKHYDINFHSICEQYPHISELKGRNGKSKKEKLYKRWCLENALYINDLNDITSEPVAGQDVMGQPSVVHSLNPLIGVTDSLWLATGFSEIKHQYAHARFTYFEALDSQYAKSEVAHYASNDLYLASSLDYCIYRRDIEQFKISFRLLYSCFDKLAVLLFRYLNPKSKAKIYFSNVWYESNRKVKQFFLDSKNPYLLALYWLSREINDNEEEGHDYWMDSNAMKLADIRNKMEHGGFRVVVDDLYKISKSFDEDRSSRELEKTKKRLEENKKILKSGVSKENQLKIKEKINKDEDLIEEKEYLNGYPLVITDKELKDQTIRLMKKVRYAMMYTSLAIHYEEERLDNRGTVMGFEIPMYD